MGNKTFIPAFKARVGDWDYYICQMKYAELARQVGFGYELGGNKDLSTMIQRGISDRTNAIRDYLLQSQHRFLGALIVAAWGGQPEYVPLQMEDPDGMLKDLDKGFGVLTLDGTHQFFALDGQHRLKAIKDAVQKDPKLGSEDIAILLVPHQDTAKGRERTRRLFTNINRNAKNTTQAENIALDVDDGYAVLTRQFLTENQFLKREGVVMVYTRVGNEGELSLAGSSIPKTEPKAWTTITVLYEMLKGLGFGLDARMDDLSTRPSDEVLANSYRLLDGRLDDLLKHCGNLKARLLAAPSARDLRSPKGSADSGHPFMRPVIQRAIVGVARQVMDQNELSWDQLMSRLSKLDWSIGKAPWTAVYSPERGAMVAGKDFADLLFHLLYVHVAPRSSQQIRQARKAFRELKGSNYPVSETKLEGNLKFSKRLSQKPLG